MSFIEVLKFRRLLSSAKWCISEYLSIIYFGILQKLNTLAYSWIFAVFFISMANTFSEKFLFYDSLVQRLNNSSLLRLL